jgi:hypothetical protein
MPSRPLPPPPSRQGPGDGRPPPDRRPEPVQHHARQARGEFPRSHAYTLLLSSPPPCLASDPDRLSPSPTAPFPSPHPTPPPQAQPLYKKLYDTATTAAISFPAKVKETSAYGVVYPYVAPVADPVITNFSKSAVLKKLEDHLKPKLM